MNVFNIKGHTLDNSRESYYPNITGYIRGDARFYNITPVALEKNKSLSWKPLAERYVSGANVTEMIELGSTWNWTASTKLVMTLHEKEPLAMQNSRSKSKDLVAVHVCDTFRQGSCFISSYSGKDGAHR